MEGWPSGSATFVFTDIVGSTPLVHALGDRYLALLETHNTLLRAAWAEHGGIEVKTDGDSFFVAFADATDAVRACIDAQRALASHRWTDGVSLQVRMGAHRGEATIVGRDYHGLPVNIAARVAAAAHGGQVLVSADVLEGARLGGDLRVRALGAHGLKGIPDPITLFQVVASGLIDAFPPPATLRAARHNLPHPANALRGRERELAKIVELLLGDARIVTIVGSGGIGKTRLALEAAHELLAYVPGGVFLLEAAGVSATEQLLPRLAETLGFSLERDADPVDQIAATFSEPTLVIADNLEHLRDVGDPIAQLIAATPHLRILASSRSRLRIRAEQVIVLDPLEVPGHVTRLEDLESIPSAQVFLDRARATDHSREWSDEDVANVVSITQRLDGVPLAIELAAARLADRSLSSIVAGLEHAGELLSEGDLDLPPRQRSMLAAIRWSVDLLPDDVRSTLVAASVFRGGAPRDGLESVAGRDIEADLRVLAAASLIRRADDGRVLLLEPVRAAAEELADDVGSLQARHVDWFTDLARRAWEGMGSHQQLEWIDRLSPEADNFDRVLKLADPDVGLEVAGGLSRFWSRTGRIVEGLTRIDGALSHARPDATGTARAMFGRGSILRKAGKFDDAVSQLRAAIAAADTQRDDETAILAGIELGDTYRVEGDNATAQRALEESLGVALQQQRTALAGAAAHNLALACRSDDPERTVHLLRSAVDSYRIAGDAYNVARAEMDLSVVLLSRGAVDDAATALKEILPFIEASADAALRARYAANLGMVAHLAGDPATAITRTQEAVELVDEDRDPLGRLEALRNLGGLLNSIEDVHGAVAVYEEALALRRRAGLRGHQPIITYAAAFAALEIEEPARALRILLAEQHDVEEGPYSGATSLVLALTQSRLGHRAGAQETVRLARERLGDQRVDATLLSLVGAELGEEHIAGWPAEPGPL